MPRPDAFLCSIGYAEDWLRRARDDWRRGNAAAAIRRLMLAEAEIRHARETGATLRSPYAGRTRDGGGWRLIGGLAAAALIAAGVGYASIWVGSPQPGAVAVRGAPGPLRGGVGRTIVQLDTGRYLMPDRGEDSQGAAPGPSFFIPGRAGGGALGERFPHVAAPWPLGPGPQRRQDPRESQPPVGMPVDLRTSSPTF